MDCRRPEFLDLRKCVASFVFATAIVACALPIFAQTANTTTNYSYDSLDQLTQVTDPDNLVTKYQRDGLSNLTTKTSPDTGTTARTFDAAGNVLTSTDAKGITTSYTYDALDRLLTVSYPDSTQNITLAYDEPNSATGCPASASVGRLTRIIENSVTTVFCYDLNGHITQKSQTVNGKTDITTYTRSPAGRLLTVTYPSGNMVSFTRDGAGRVSGVSVTTSTGTKTLASNITHLPFGPISSYTLGNGQTVTRNHDANYRMTDLVSPTVSLHVARDAAGNVTATGNSPGANPATETYSYDPMQRLTAITGANGTVTAGVAYNHTGDRLSKAGSGLATGNYGYNPGTHQLIATGTDTRAVDANGNTTAINQAGSSYSFSYNNRNKLSAAQANAAMFATYTYNANGERVAKTVNNATERFSYDEDGQLIGEYGATSRDYVWLEGIPLANIDTQGTSATIAYVTADHQGTPRAVADGSGNTIWQLPYLGNAWEEQAPQSNGYILNLRSTGEYYDAETGLNYNLQRYRDPQVGRFLQPDPKGLAGGINPYVAVRNSPLRYTDRHGLQEADVSEEEVEALRSEFARPLGPNTANYEDMVGNPFRLNPGETLEHFRLRQSYQFEQQCSSPEKLERDKAKGGIYGLYDPVNGDLKYVGRTNDFDRREPEHRRDPNKRGYEFQAISPTDDYATQRGLEQTYMNMYDPPLNRANGISPFNQNYDTYMDAAQSYLFGVHK
ncbi:Rhs family protein [Burkholderia pseudomallei]|nr:Rhs family protein [Burkholderia pseudomallei]CAJ9264166.1 Rhs family protein [Burkholderia pseudomallei]